MVVAWVVVETLPGRAGAVARRLEATTGLEVKGDDEERAEARFTVRADLEELERPEGQPELLAAIAAGTGGEQLRWEGDLATLDLQGADAVTVDRTTTTPAWDRWWWLLAAALPLGAEWFLRRRWGAV